MRIGEFPSSEVLESLVSGLTSSRSLSCLDQPYCVILPWTAEAVSTALLLIASFNVTFAIRAGGHSPNPGWSSVGQGGILVDLQYLDEISISNDTSVASVGAGARWGDVVDVANARNVSVVGTRTPDVGVGGSILGGRTTHRSVQNVHLTCSRGLRVLH